MKLSKDDKYYEIKLSTLNTEKVSLYKLLRILTKKKRNKKKNTLSLLRKTKRSMQKQQNKKVN